MEEEGDETNAPSNSKLDFDVEATKREILLHLMEGYPPKKSFSDISFHFPTRKAVTRAFVSLLFLANENKVRISHDPNQGNDFNVTL